MSLLWHRQDRQGSLTCAEFLAVVARLSLASELLSVSIGTVHSSHCAGDGHSDSYCFGREGIMLLRVTSHYWKM